MAPDRRWNRRLIGMLRARLPDAGLQHVEDRRKARGKRWPLEVLLRGVVVALMAGCKSLFELERLTTLLSPAARKQLRLWRRIPDTTLRTVCCHVYPNELRKAIHRLVRAAHRRKALTPVGLPFGVVALDGKATGLSGCDTHFGPPHSGNARGEPLGILRSVTCALISSAPKLIIDVVAQARRNEMATFRQAFLQLVDAYGRLDLFRLVTYDAGACSKRNATLVRERGYHYLFALKKPQKALLPRAQSLLAALGSDDAQATTEDVLGGGRRVLRRLYITERMAGFGWDHLSTVLRVQSQAFDRQRRLIAQEDRYFISSLARAELSDRQWLRLVRLHWAVENECHGTLDVAFEEDHHLWIEKDPHGAFVILLLRRIAFNLLALFRSVTQRSPRQRAVAWKQLLYAISFALLTLDARESAGLRLRPAPAPS
jgi:hypothetical protein